MDTKNYPHIHRLAMCGLKVLVSGFPGNFKRVDRTPAAAAAAAETDQKQ